MTQIFIITRRFEGEFEMNSPVCSIEDETFKPLWDFWFDMLYPSDGIGIPNHNDKNHRRYFQEVQTNLAKNKIEKEFILYPLIEFLILNKFKTEKKEMIPNPDFLLKFHIQPDNSDIFVYHHLPNHWNETKGTNISDLFIPALRNSFIDYYLKINNNRKKEEITVNWLVHDEDLATKGTDGLIYFDTVDRNERNPYFSDKSNLKKLFSLNPEMKNDNFWIFTHEKGKNGYYDLILLKPYKSNNHLKSAEDLYKFLCVDTVRLNLMANQIYAIDQDLPYLPADCVIKEFIQYHNKACSFGQTISAIVNEPTYKSAVKTWL